MGFAHRFRRNHSGPLSYHERMKLPAGEFVFPERRAYPIPDAAHARDALSRVSAHGTEEEKEEVCKAVAARYPEIHAQSCGLHREGETL